MLVGRVFGDVSWPMDGREQVQEVIAVLVVGHRNGGNGGAQKRS